MISSFPPISAGDARVLVLGSMPGKRSLAQNQYYGHPRNAFWPIMATLFDFDAQAPYRRRLAALKANRIALWDVLACCERPGSLDSAIVPGSVRSNDFCALLSRLRHLHAIFFNGSAAETLWRRHALPELPAKAAGIHSERLPSTSPAYAAMRFEEKLARWITVREFAGPA